MTMLNTLENYGGPRETVLAYRQNLLSSMRLHVHTDRTFNSFTAASEVGQKATRMQVGDLYGALLPFIAERAVRGSGLAPGIRRQPWRRRPLI